MTRKRSAPARVFLLGAVAAVLIGATAWALGNNEPEPLPARPANARPTLMLLTSLPLVFPAEFGLQGGGSKTLEVLETRYTVVPIGIADAQSLRPGRLLFMAHPLAQPAEALVDLDQWVRSGGRLLLLADPKLEWPSERPLGDKLRPPPGFADTGLLAHWGMRLDAPDQPGPAERTIDKRQLLLGSPGTLSGSCAIAGDGLIARCLIGKGQATIIADADLLQPKQASPSELNGNLQFLIGELARLESSRESL